MNTIQSTNTSPFGVWLSNELNVRGLSQSDLARMCNITRAQVSRIILGKGNVGPKSLARIALALNVSLYLVFEKAGFLPQELSSAKQKLIGIIKDLPDSDVESLIALAAPVSVYRI